MKTNRSWLLPIALVTLSLWGCQTNPPPTDLSENNPQAVEFVGEIRPTLVGTWSNPIGITIDLKADGAAGITSDVTMRGQNNQSFQSGKWKATDKELRLQMGQQVMEYTYTLTADELSLKSRRDPKPVLYKRSAPEAKEKA
jgi:hypothetical protein